VGGSKRLQLRNKGNILDEAASGVIVVEPSSLLWYLPFRAKLIGLAISRLKKFNPIRERTRLMLTSDTIYR
jgi:hypothetical protein